MHSVAVGRKFDGNNRRPHIMCCSASWRNTTDSVNTDHSDGTETWRVVWIGWNGYFEIYLFFDVRVRGYFSKPKGVHEQRSLGNTGLDKFHAAEGYAVNLSSATFRPAFVRPSGMCPVICWEVYCARAYLFWEAAVWSLLFPPHANTCM